MSLSPKYKFTVLPYDFIDDHVLAKCATLFSNHYGIWASGGPQPGKRVRINAARLKREYLFDEKKCFLVTAEDKDGTLIGHAFACRFPFRERFVCLWITQLVVHREHRNKGVATDLLAKCISRDENAAWALCSSHPHAVRALEKMARRRCDPALIKCFGRELIQASSVPYLLNCPLSLDASQSLIHTNFHVDHTEVNELIADQGEAWTLGSLNEGDEFLAITFSSDFVDHE